MASEILILSGLPGSGKTHRALEWVAEDPTQRVRVNYDDLRLELYGPDWVFNRLEEAAMKVYARERVVDALTTGMSVVIDNTNLSDKVRNSWIELGALHGATPVFEEIDTPVSVCVRRDRGREGRAHVGRAVIERMGLFYGFIDLSDRTLYPRDFIIVDMDGTVASCEARRKVAFTTAWCSHCKIAADAVDWCGKCGNIMKPKRDWDKFYEGVENDPPIEAVVKLVELLSEPCCSPSSSSCDVWPHGLDVIVVSGRSLDKCGKGTEAWLDKHLPVGVTHLFMRNGGDYREDSIIKQEILDLLPKERIRYVLDDRQRVVDMWRANGLTCLQVAPGDF